jgi:hypothetical protein
MAILYIGAILLLLIGFVSLAVDIGRVRLARAQVQTAADAAARAGAVSLPFNVNRTIDAACTASRLNPVIDATHSGPDPGSRIDPGLELEPDEDILFGIWDPLDRTFTPLEQDAANQDIRRRANAVQVIGRRTEARGNPIPLIFAPALRAFDKNMKLGTDIQRDAIAYVNDGPAGFGFVGLEHINSTGSAIVDSMIYGQSSNGGGGFASDEDIDLSHTTVYGDVRPGIRGRIIQGSRSTVTGWMAPLDFRLADLDHFKPVSAVPSGAREFTPPKKNKGGGNGNGNGRGNKKEKGPHWIIPPANQEASNDPDNPREFWISKVDLEDEVELRVRGYVTLYVLGIFHVDDNEVIADSGANDPRRLKVYVIGNGDVDLGGKPGGGSRRQYMHVHAPGSEVDVRGDEATHFYGWITGRTLRLSHNSNLHYDETRTADYPRWPRAPREPYRISLVD